MGNQLHKNVHADNSAPTPTIVDLTAAEVESIKSTWKIPSANVSAEV